MTKSNIHKALGAAALLGMVLLTGCQDVSTDLKPPKYKTSIPENATRISSFKAEFPQQYASYMKNNETSVMTEYKGSIPYPRMTTSIPCPRDSSTLSPISRTCGWVTPLCTNTMKPVATPMPSRTL